MTSYLTLQAGTPVRSSDGKDIGEVEHVLADADADIFDGLVIDTRLGPGGHRFVDSEQVARIDEDGVTLTLDERAAQDLHEPSASPATMETAPGDKLPGKLRRAWDLISGNY
jgi:hypothetical protein